MNSRFRNACLISTALLLAAASHAQVQVVSSLITTLAGNGTGCTGQTDTIGDGCPSTGSVLRNPTGDAVDSAGNLYIADANDGVIRKVSAATGEITNVAGTDLSSGFSGDKGPATSAEFSTPVAVAVDAAGDLFIVDSGNMRIREISAATGDINTIAGNGSTGYTGDNGQATSATLKSPFGIAVNPAGTLVYIADSGNNVVRLVNLTTGIITTYAGNGTEGYAYQGSLGDGGPATSAEFASPSGVALDSQGNLYIADTYNSEIRKVTKSTGIITTVAGYLGSPNYGGDGGPATKAFLYYPSGVTVDSFGNIIIADSYNCLIREVNAGTGIITTVAGNTQDAGFGRGSYGGDNGPPTLANLNLPDGVAVDSKGNLFIADTQNNAIREVGAPSSHLSLPQTNVGSASVSQNVSLYITSYCPENNCNNPGGNSLAISSITVAQSLGGSQEFTVGTISGCVVDGVTQVDAGSVCTVPITFHPEYPGLQEAPLEVVTSAGTFYFGLSGIGMGPQPALLPGVISTVAGTGANGYTGDNGPATSATFAGVYAVAVDYAGNQYIDDYDNDVFRKVTASTGVITTFAGDGTEGYAGDLGPAASAEIDIDWNAGTDAAGNVYIADTNNNMIRKVDAVTGIITTPVGVCCSLQGTGMQGYNGDGIPSYSAELFLPQGVVTDGAGNLYIADYGNNRIREVYAATGTIATVAGTGFGNGATGTGGYTGDSGPATSAELDGPDAIAIDSAGNIYIADFFNNAVRKVTAATGIITTVAGNGTHGATGDNGPATSAEISSPIGVAVDAAGDLYIAFGAGTVRKVDAATGIITSVAGGGSGCTGQSDSVGDGCGETSVTVGAQNIATDSAGNLYIADQTNNRVRKVSLTTAPITFPQTAVGSSSAAITFNLANIGNVPLNLSAIAPSANFGVDSGTTTCSTSEAVPAGGSCEIGVVFSPTTGGATTGTLKLTDNALNVTGSTQQVQLNGAVGQSSGTPDFTITTLTPTMEVSQAGNSATYIVTITPLNGFSGTIAFGVCCDSALGVSLPASITIPSNGTAQNINFTIASAVQLGVGTFSETFTGSTVGGLQHSLTLNLKVDNPGLTPTVTVAPTSSSITTTQADSVMVTVNGGSGNPVSTGSVTLTSGTYSSGAVTLSSGSATINIPAGSLATSLDTLTATYTPDSAGALIYTSAVGSNTVTVTGSSLSFVSNVGTALPAQLVTVPITTAGTPSAIQVLTQGLPNLDFTETSGGTCATTTAYTVGQTCTVNVIFKPKVPGARPGAVLLTDASNDILGIAYLPGTGIGPEIAFNPGVQSILPDYSGQNAAVPQGVAVDAGLNVYVVDLIYGWIIKYSWTGSAYGAPVQLPFTGLYNPEGVAVDGAGDVFAADEGNSRVVELPWNGSSYGTQIVLASYGFEDYPTPTAVAVDSHGNLFFVVLGQSTVPSALMEMPWTGSGYGSPTTITAAAGLNDPLGVAVDANLNIYIADYGNSRVLEIPWNGTSFGAEITVASGIGAGGVAVDGAGDVYITNGSSSSQVVEVPWNGTAFGTPVTPSVPLVSGAELYGIAVDGYGNLYIASDAYERVVELNVSTPPSLSFANTTVGSVSTDSPQTVAVSNIGNAPLTFSLSNDPNYPTDFPENTSGTSLCSSTSPLTQGGSCNVSINFKPTTTGPLSEDVVLTDNNLNVAAAMQSIQVNGMGLASSGPAASLEPSPVTFTGQMAGTTSLAMAVTLSNTGNAALTGITPTLTGTFPSDFAITAGANACTATLAAGSSCNIYVTFTPASEVNYTATLSVADNASNTPQTVSLNGAGVTFTSYVGTAQPAQTVTVDITTAGTLNSIQALTLGAPNLDFTLGSAGTCATATAYTVGQTCTVNVIFAPRYPGGRYGAVVLTNSSGALLGIASLSGIGFGPQIIFGSPTQSTLGGGFSSPQHIAVDGKGDVYVADQGHGAVKEIPAGCTSSSCVITIASGFSFPAGMSVDGGGDIFFADIGGVGGSPASDNLVEEIPFGCTSATCFKTMGSGFLLPDGVGVDVNGDLFVADWGNNAIKELMAVGGVVPTAPTISVLDGGFTGTTGPDDVALDSSGNVYVPDNRNGHAVYELPAVGGYTTLKTLSASFTGPESVALDGAGNVYVADESTNSIDEMLVGSSGIPVSPTIVTLPSSISSPQGVAVDGSGNVYISDNGNNRVVELNYGTPPSQNFSTPTNVGATDTTDGPQTVTLKNNGNSELIFTSITPSTNFTVDSGTTTCSISSPLAAGASCVIGVDFAPTAGGALNGALTVTGISILPTSSAYSIPLSGTGVSALTAQAINFTQPTTPVTYSSGLTIPLVATGGASGNAIVFTIDGSSTGTGSISGSTLNVTTPGSFVIDANQAGNSTYSAAPQVQRTVIVNQAAQTINFTQPTSPVVYSGTSFTVPLSATGGSSGSAVIFTIDASSTATGSISGSTLTVTSAGNLVIDANQAGNTDYSAATQVQRTVVVNTPGAQTIIFTQPNTPVTWSSGLTISLVATGGASGNPVVFTIDGSSTGTGSISGSTLNVTTPGSFVIDANQAGNSTYSAASQVQRTVVVNQAAQTINFTQPTSPVVYSGTPLTVPLSATGGASGNPVVFTIDGSSTATGSISGSTLTVTSAGNLVIDANQVGNTDYSAATQVQRTVVVNAPGAQAINFTQPTTPVTWSSGLTIPLVATGGASGNPVVFTIDGSSTGTGSITGSSLNVTTPGNFVIDANQTGNSTYSAAPQVQRTVVVNQASQTINFTQPTSPVTYGGTSVSVPLTATGGASGNAVVFTIDSSSIGTGSISGSTLTVTSVGNFVIDANQTGNTNYSAATQVQRTVVANALIAQAINFTQPTTPISYSSGLTIPLIATGGGSGNPVVFTIDGSSTGTGSISGSTLTVTSVGSFVIDANEAGNSNYSAAPQVQRAVVVSQAPQVINFTQPNSPVTYSSGLTVPLSATGGASGNAVVFTVDSSSTGTGTISGSTLTVTKAGNLVIDANQAGNADYSAAPQVQRTVVVNVPAPDFSVSSTTSSQSVAPGGSAVYSITVADVGSAFTSAVTLSVSGLPTGATGTFNPASVTPGSTSANSTLTVTIPATASVIRPNLWPVATPVLAVLFMLPFGRWRKVWKGKFLLLVVGLASLACAASLTGCGGGFGFIQSQTYTLTITGASGTNTHSTTVPLTVQQ